jgi:hypothetical protein
MPLSTIATSELVVPRSMPTILLIASAKYAPGRPKAKGRGGVKQAPEGRRGGEDLSHGGCGYLCSRAHQGTDWSS